MGSTSRTIKAGIERKAEQACPKGAHKLGGGMAYCPLYDKRFDVRNAHCEENGRCGYYEGCFENGLTTIAIYCSHPFHTRKKE